jgi:hypothetical protein
MRYALLFAGLVMVAVAASRLRAPDAAQETEPAPVAAKVRPSQPPTRESRHPARDEPGPPVPTAAMRRTMAEKARGAPDPGMVAFRTFSDLYVDANLDFARKQAEREGITVEEVRELTGFGLLVLATQRVTDVEEVLGRPLTEEQRESLSALMTSANRDFKDRMRALVAAGASESERWRLIRDTRARYLSDFYAATGMNQQLLDDLLAGNMLLPGAPAATEPPGQPVTPAGPRDDVAAPVRPPPR